MGLSVVPESWVVKHGQYSAICVDGQRVVGGGNPPAGQLRGSPQACAHDGGFDLPT